VSLRVDAHEYSELEQATPVFEIEVANYAPSIAIRNARQEATPSPWLGGGAPNKVVKLAVFRFLRRAERPTRCLEKNLRAITPPCTPAMSALFSLYRTFVLYHV
jgi:hypothetical protein